MQIIPGSIVMSLTQEKSENQLGELAKHCNLFEYRADLHDSVGISTTLHQLQKIRGFLPVILTARADSEGGKWIEHGKTEQERLDFLKASMSMSDIVDFEIQSEGIEDIFRRAHSSSCQALGSFHNFGDPIALEEYMTIVAKGLMAGADLIKIVANTEAPGTLETLKQLNSLYRGKIITVSLGQNALNDRVELVRNGSLMTYGHDGYHPSAPTQPSCEDLQFALAH